MADRRAGHHWTGYVYYYAASLIGLGLVIGGLVGVFRGMLQTALPRATPEFRFRADEPLFREPPFREGGPSPATPSPAEIDRAEREAVDELRTEGLYSAAQGASFAIVGGPVFLWHIRRAREREGLGETSTRGRAPPEPEPSREET